MRWTWSRKSHIIVAITFIILIEQWIVWIIFLIVWIKIYYKIVLIAHKYLSQRETWMDRYWYMIYSTYTKSSHHANIFTFWHITPFVPFDSCPYPERRTKVLSMYVTNLGYHRPKTLFRIIIFLITHTTNTNKVLV